MAERGKGGAVAAIALLAAALIGAGVALDGGPAQGRKERRDDQRAADLLALGQQIDCRAREGLPPDGAVAPTPGCPAEPRQADPFTGAPYRIEVIDGITLRLCAGFELPPDPASGRFGGAQRDGDCIVQHLYYPELPAPPAAPEATIPPPPIDSYRAD